jgi:hypothetical protein
VTPEQLLPWKLRLFWAGALLMAIGVILDRRPVMLASAVILFVGILLRFVYRAPPPPRHPDWDEPDPPQAPPAQGDGR